MKKDLIAQKMTGVVVPLGALYTKNNAVIGEFPDLIWFGDFCKECGFKIIQLLPVNDSGTQSSPYSGLSAFALNPIYIRLNLIESFESFYKQDKKFQKEYDNFFSVNKYCSRYDYDAILNTKNYLLKKIYEYSVINKLIDNKKLDSWINKNEWVKIYCVYKNLKYKYMQASWKSWPKQDKEQSLDQILNKWNEPSIKNEHLFYAWCQMIAFEQFTDATQAVRKNGILIKGDMPILMNEDSCDAWAYPEFFNHNLRAGSPSDFDNPMGQNWGFPTYNWKNLKQSGYSWWKERLQTASQFYDAYRLDHILGFFRIWAIPSQDSNALLGHTEPYSPIKVEELYECGFDDDRIRWLSKSHIPTSAIQDIVLDYDVAVEILNKYADRIGNEELWLFNKRINGSQEIWDSDLSKICKDEYVQNVKAKLVEYWSNRTLLEIAKNKYLPLWTYGQSTSWASLNENEKSVLTQLFQKNNLDNEKVWEKQAEDIFKNITTDLDMIPCGEDLGVNITCVPKVMAKNNILGLKVIRWCRKWQEENQPYIDFEDYEKLSVATTSVHDSSTIRQWASEENKEEIDEEFIFELLKKCSKANSVWYINPLQDYLYLNKNYWMEKAEDERINVPGTVTKFNWTYRMPVSIEELCADKSILEKIKEICKR